MVTASGSSAISAALLSQLSAGDEVIATRQLYGGSYKLLRDIFPRYGIVVRQVDADLEGIERMVTPRTKTLYVETPTNPTLRLVDLKRAANFAREWGILAVIDNTFATPVLQKPLPMGFHIVVHSASKYLAGHSDVIAGAAAGSAALMRQVRANMIQMGGSMDPEAAFLLIRGMKTLDVRVERQCRSAMTVARFLEKHPKVARVHYPGLAFASGPSTGQTADARVRGHAGVRSQGPTQSRIGRRAALLRSRACFSACRQPWRSRIAGDPADLHVALQYVAR